MSGRHVDVDVARGLRRRGPAAAREITITKIGAMRLRRRDYYQAMLSIASMKLRCDCCKGTIVAGECYLYTEDEAKYCILCIEWEM
jgi:hypothetical protein